MSQLREAAQQAIALICSARLCEVNSMSSRQEMLRLMIEATDTLRAALAQQAEPVEPVAWMVYTLNEKSVCITDDPEYFTDSHRALPLYTAPPQRKPLTDEEIDRVTDKQWEWAGLNNQPIYAAYRAYARAIEQAHGITGPEDSEG